MKCHDFCSLIYGSVRRRMYTWGGGQSMCMEIATEKDNGKMFTTDEFEGGYLFTALSFKSFGGSQIFKIKNWEK